MSEPPARMQLASLALLGRGHVGLGERAYLGYGTSAPGPSQVIDAFTGALDAETIGWWLQRLGCWQDEPP